MDPESEGGTGPVDPDRSAFDAFVASESSTVASRVAVQTATFPRVVGQIGLTAALTSDSVGSPRGDGIGEVTSPSAVSPLGLGKRATIASSE